MALQFHASFLLMPLRGTGEAESFITMNDVICPKCKTEMKVSSILDERTAIFKCHLCRSEYKVSFDEQRFPSNLNNFNWGACVLWHLWGLWNGIPVISAIALIMGFLSTPICMVAPSFGIFIGLIDIGIAIYLGMKGNAISWKRKRWSSVEAFETSQDRWRIAAIGIVICIIMLICFNLILL